MARTFRGESVHKVDTKGRVSIPASFRRVLQDCDPDWKEGLSPNIVIVYGDRRRNYLEGYHMEAIEEVDAKISLLPRGSKARKKLENLFSGQSHPTQVDETGRLVLPAKLREKIGIMGEAYFVATGDTFQIWEPAAYAAHEADLDRVYDEYDDDFDPLELLDQAQPDAD